MDDEPSAEHLPVGVVRIDGDGIIRAANAAFRRWAGVDDPVGDAVERHLVVVEDFLVHDVPLSTMMASPSDPDRAALVTSADDGAGDGDGAGAVLTVLDASDRLAAGRRLRDSHALADRTQVRLQLIIDASIAFASATSDDLLADILATTAARAYGAEESAVFIVDEGDGRVRLASGTNPFDGLVSVDLLTLAAANLRQVITASGPLEASTIAPSAGAMMTSRGVEAIIAAPIQGDHGSLGFFACFFRHPRRFDEEASPLAEALASQAARTLSTIRLQHRLEHAATHDETTGLPNRRYLEERIPDRAPSARAVIFVDLDGFKAVNDRLGHAEGDRVLREVARRLHSAVPEDATVARFGGDEFVVICSADAGPDVARVLGRVIATPYPFLPGALRLSASIGIAVGGTADEGIDPLIRAADQAMYRAKNAGGGRVVTAD